MSHPLFCAAKNHTVKLTGSGQQIISRGEKYSGDYIQFANLVVSQEAAGSTVFESVIQVCGKVRHETTLITGTTRLNGATLEGSRLYGDVEFVEKMNLDKDYTFAGNVYTESSGTTTIRNSHVTVEGNFYQNGGTLAVSGENGVLTILGDYIAEGDSRHYISSGTVEIVGDMVRENGYVVAAQDTELVFTGTKEQHIELSHANTKLENVVVDNPAGVVVSDDVAVINVVSRQGVLSYASGGIHGFTLEEDGEYDGDLVIAGGVLDLNGHSYHVKGNLTIKNGVLKMTDKQDYLLVDGDFETESTISQSGYLTSGTMELKGDFSQKENANSFVTTNQHTMVFSGDKVQEISFVNNASSFNNLKMVNKEKVVFHSVVSVYGTVTQECPAEGTLGINKDTIFIEDTYQGDVRFKGSITLKEDFSIIGNVYMGLYAGCNLGSSQLMVDGTVYMEFYSYLETGKGSLVCQNLHVSECESFCMEDSAGSVIVKENAYFEAFVNQNLKAGTLMVGGDITFRSYKGKRIWTFSEDVNVILNGSTKQVITMCSNENMLGNLILQNTSEEGVYVSDYLICRSVDNTAGTKVTFADGGMLGYTLEEDKVIEGDLLLSGGEMNLNGHTLTVKGDLIQGDAVMDLNGGCLDIEGNYYIAKCTKQSNGTYSYAATRAELVMTQEQERITVQKNLYTAFESSSNLQCTGGTIELLGNLQILSGGFSIDKDSTVLFNGTKQQKVTSSDRTAGFGNVTIANEEGISADSYFYVKGNLQTNGYSIYGTVYCRSGVTMSEDTICANLCFADYMDLQKDIYVKGNVNLGKLSLNDHHLTVEGNCTLNDTDSISQPDGILEIKGDIINKNSYYNGSGTNQVILSGDEKQTIADSGMKFSFQELVIDNTSEEGVYSAGLFDAEMVTDPEHKLTFYIEGEAGYTLTKDTVITGNFTQLLGTMDLNGHTLTVMGDYNQKNGVMKLNGGELKIHGNYTLGNLDTKGNYVTNHARLSMNQKEDMVYVEGNVKLASEVALAGEIKQGIFEVKGDFSYDCKNNSDLSQEVIFIFSGEKKQTVSKNGYNFKFGTIQRLFRIY